MSVVNEWTKKIAEAAVPEEIDLAPSVAHAFFQAEKSGSSYFNPNLTNPKMIFLERALFLI